MEEAIKRAVISINEDNLDELKILLLNEEVDANSADEDGMCLLVQAAYKGNDDMCKLLLEHGADVNKKSRNNDYTALMMAGLAGKLSTVELLLKKGAKTELKNSIGKIAAELSAFVGQQECSDLIRNFMSMDLLLPYYTAQGSNEPRISYNVACHIQKIAIATNYTPVKIVKMISECEELCSDVEIMKKASSAMDDLCSKCVRNHGDFEEVLALKCHYIAYLIEQCIKYMEKNQTKDLTKYLKRLLKEDDGGVKIYSEDAIRKSVSTFPYNTLPVIQEFVRAIYPLKIGEHPTANHCLHTIFNGLRSTSGSGSKCLACGERNAEAKCSACKQVRYCSPSCQKIHWSVHKVKCKK